jgi:hypothetical protein
LGISIVAPVLVEKVRGIRLQARKLQHYFSGSLSGAVDNALLSVSAAEAYDDFAEILNTDF